MDLAERGRKPKTDARKSVYQLRLSDVEARMLDYIFEKTGKSKAEILRDGLKSQYNLARFSEF